MTFKVPFALVIVAHMLRCILHNSATSNPQAELIRQQVMDALMWDEASRCLSRDRDQLYAGNQLLTEP